MVSARISKESMSGIKILLDRSPDKLSIVQIISRLVHKELIENNIAICSKDGYHTVGEKVISNDGVELDVLMIDNGEAKLISTDGKVYSIGVTSGTAWAMKGIEQ